MKLNSITSRIRNHARKRSFKLNDFTVVSSNCVGGTIYKDLGLEYKTPFVGLYITPNHYVQLCENFEYFMKMELQQLIEPRFKYPIGKLNNIVIHFVHYNSFDQAKKSWNKRISRINFKSLFFILVERDGCTFEDLLKFDQLSLNNKVSLTKTNYSQLKHSHYIKGFENQVEVGDLLAFRNMFSGKRFMYEFDFANWIRNAS